MNKTSEIASYLLDHYPYPKEFSAARLTKMVYLCDWLSSIRHDRQITPIQWVFHLYGPYTDEVVDDLLKDQEPNVTSSWVLNSAGNRKRLIQKAGNLRYDSLTQDERNVADHVIEFTKQMNFADFIEFVYSTHPIMVSERFSSLDLPALAEEYRAIEGLEV